MALIELYTTLSVTLPTRSLGLARASVLRGIHERESVRVRGRDARGAHGATAV